MPLFYFFSINTQNPVTIPVVDDGCYDFVLFKGQKAILETNKPIIPHTIPFKLFAINQVKPPYKLLISTELSFFTIKVQPWANHIFFLI